MKLKIFRAASIVLLLAVMTAVFCLSAEPADVSQETSDGFLYRVFCVFYPQIKTMTTEEIEELFNKFSSPIRKLAHFSVFGLMGVFSLLSVISYKAPKVDLRCLGAWLFCVLYAVSDEIHQRFVPGRSGELRDVLIDSSGALLGILAIIVIVLIIQKKGSKKIEE